MEEKRILHEGELKEIACIYSSFQKCKQKATTKFPPAFASLLLDVTSKISINQSFSILSTFDNHDKTQVLAKFKRNFVKGVQRQPKFSKIYCGSEP